MWLAFFTFALLAGQLQAGGNKPAVDGSPGARLERYLRYYNAWPDQTMNVKVGPFKPTGIPGLQETTVEISAKQGSSDPAKETVLVSDDGRYVVQGTMLRTDEDPFRANRERLDLRNQAGFGAPIPEVTIVEYADFQCGYCKMLTHVLRQQVPQAFPREVRVVFKDFPLAQIHPWAMEAAITGRCILKQNEDAFWAYHDWAYEQQSQFTPQNFDMRVIGFVSSLASSGKKLDAGKLTACTHGPEARAEVDQSLKEGQALGVDGTPTLFVNGRRMVGNQPLDAIRQAIMAEIDYAESRESRK